jgi:mRNA-degrading endonuclease RelE of RelBE toxin-antitoxin system
MNHFASPSFWDAYEKLPQRIQKLADKNFGLLKNNPRYPSLHLKHISNYWSVRIGKKYSAIAIEIEEGVLWFWIGTHAEYDQQFK